MKKTFLRRYLCLIALLLAICTAFAGCELFEDLSWSDGEEFFTPSTPDKPNSTGGEGFSSASDESEDESTETEELPPDIDELYSNTADGDEEEEDTGRTTEVGDQRDAERELGVPEYCGVPFYILNNDIPQFTVAEKVNVVAYERYPELDDLGRCGQVEACVGEELMPTEIRKDISSVKPSGWVNNKYDTELVDGGYIYNRCHLIGFQLAGENANEKNLITGTRYMNVEGMLPFENMIADHVKETKHHVMYRVTPVYDGDDLVACGVILEAYSVEDGGELQFNVYVYNVQPGIIIDYATGENWLSDKPIETQEITETQEGIIRKYILNTRSKKIHLPDCAAADSISEANNQEYVGDINSLIAVGYEGCGICKPVA